MKKIIDNKLYDTEKPTKIYEYRHKWFKQGFGMPDGWGFIHWEIAEVYKTNNGNYFVYFYDENNEDRERIEIRTEAEVKKIIQELNVDKYLELFGNIDVEEA